MSTASNHHWSNIPAPVLAVLRQGAVMPAHPLALDQNRNFDVQAQRALARYYIDAGSGGLAVGVHSTQFAIRDVGLYQPVLEMAAKTAADWTNRPLVMVAGVVGKTEQAVREAQTARGLGYHAALFSLAAMKGVGEDELIAHCQRVAQ
jgi:dihydrodipicolinate synthase/N-acetylneuraminate lyase